MTLAPGARLESRESSGVPMFRPGSLGLDAPPADDRYRMNAGVRSRSK